MILGPLEMRASGRRVDVSAISLRALLARLLLDANRVISSEQLVADLWVSPPSTGVRALHQRVAQLRQVLERGGAGADLVDTRGAGYVIDIEGEQLDLRRFETSLAEGDSSFDRGRPDLAAAAFADALALWRGPPLAEFPDAPFATAAGARLEELRLVALEKRFDAQLALGRHLELIGELEEIAAQHPFRESFRAKLMLALYRGGRQAEALRYHDTRRLLVEELGVEPTSALQELERAILRQDPALNVQEPATAAGDVGTLALRPATGGPSRAIVRSSSSRTTSTTSNSSFRWRSH